MPTLKKFLDQAGLILLLLQIEGLDKTNIKDLYWSTDNADVNPTVVFKVGDDNGSPHSLKKLTFKGETGTLPTGATARTLTITIGGVDKTITYYDTNNASGLNYSYSTDTGTPSSSTTVKVALDRIINAINTLDPADEKVKQTALSGSTALPILTATSGTPTSGNNAEAGYDTEFKFTPSTNTLSIGTNPTQTEVKPGEIILKLTVAGDTGQSPTNVTAEISAISYNELLEEVSELGTNKLDKDFVVEITYMATISANKTYTQIKDAYEAGKRVYAITSDNYRNVYVLNSISDSGLEFISIGQSAHSDDFTINAFLCDSSNNWSSRVQSTAIVHLNGTNSNTNLPLLLGNAITPTTGNTLYNNALSFNPSSGKVTILSPVTTSAKSVEITNTGITFATTEVGGTSVSINSSNYGGTSAKATADGNGNNIVNTYATKAALEALTNLLTSSFLIVTTLPTADGTHGGIIYLIKDQEYGDVNSNIFKEYIEVNDGTTDSPSWKFELLGTTDAGVDVVTIPATGTNSVASLFAQYVTNA